MRKFAVSLIFLALIMPGVLFAQNAPQKFNYQAVARDADGKTLTGQQVVLRIAIMSDENLDRPVYSEEHMVTTNKQGLLNIAIGGGDVLEGEFNSIDWGSAAHYLNIQMDTEGSGRFVEMGVSQLLSVPYALYAEKSGEAANTGDGRNDPNDWTINGNAGTDDNINFIGTLDAQDMVFKVNSSEAMRLTTDGRLNISTGNVISIGNLPIIHAKGTRNISVGENAGSSVGSGTGSSNAFIGFRAGNATNTGSNNAFIGSQAGNFNTSGSGSAMIGFRAGFNNTTGINNAFIGNQAGFNNTTGDFNAFIGYQAGFANSSAARSVMIGHRSGFGTTTGGENSFVGYLSGFSNVSGIQNTYIGRSAGYSSTGNFNTYLGSFAGETTTSGTRNTFVGFGSKGSNSLTNATAIGADANVTQSNSVVLGNNANVGIGTSAPAFKLDVKGDVAATGRYIDSSGDAGISGQLLSSTGTGTNWINASGIQGATGPTGPAGSDGAIGPTGATGPLVAGTSGQTLRHDGTDWVANSTVFNDGANVGVGTTSPTAKLHVEGNFRLADGTEGAGKILTSNFAGTARWQELSITTEHIFGNVPAADYACLGVVHADFVEGISVHASGQFVAVATSTGIRGYDITDPTSPTPLGASVSNALVAVRVSGNTIVGLDAANDVLRKFSISNGNIFTGTSIAIGSSATEMDVNGDFAYVADSGSDLLKVIQISNMTNFGSVGFGTGSPRSVVFLNDKVCIATASANEIRSFNVSGAPAALSTMTLGAFSPIDMTGAVDQLYVIGNESGTDQLKVVKVTVSGLLAVQSTHNLGTPEPTSVSVT